MQLINRTVREGRKVVVVRTQHNEIGRALVDQFNYDDYSDVKVKSRANGRYDLVHKSKTNKDGTPVVVGFCCAVSNLTTYQGGSYNDVD